MQCNKPATAAGRVAGDGVRWLCTSVVTGDEVWSLCMSDDTALTVTTGTVGDDDITDSDIGDSSRDGCCDGDRRTAAWCCCWGCNANEDSGTSGGEELMICDPPDMLVHWLGGTSREFNVPVLGDAPTDMVRELVDLHTTDMVRELVDLHTTVCVKIIITTHSWYVTHVYQRLSYVSN